MAGCKTNCQWADILDGALPLKRIYSGSSSSRSAKRRETLSGLRQRLAVSVA
jgi:hypothetical protein